MTQNAVGITSIAAPANGNLAFTARGFAGAGSVQQLYDGTRLYVGAGTVTFPFDTCRRSGSRSCAAGLGALRRGRDRRHRQRGAEEAGLHRHRRGAGGDRLGRRRAARPRYGGPVGEDLAYRINLSGNRADGWVKPDGDFRNLASRPR